jgi:hypothetical protein
VRFTAESLSRFEPDVDADEPDASRVLLRLGPAITDGGSAYDVAARWIGCFFW